MRKGTSAAWWSHIVILPVQSTMLQVFQALAGAIFALGLCLASGLVLMRMVEAKLDRTESILFAFLSGSACVTLLIFLLCLVHQARPGVFLAVGVIAAAAAVRVGGPQAKMPAV